MDIIRPLGGGAELVNWTTDPAKRGPFGSKVLGFSDLEIVDGAVVLRHIDVKPTGGRT